MIATSNQKKTTYLPDVGVIISGALASLSTPVIPTVMIPNPIAITLSIRSPISNNQNIAISMNAVGFAISAHANITHEMMIYLSESR